MKEVTKEEFFNTVGKLDVVLSHTGGFPYTTDWKLRHGELKGRSVDYYNEKWLSGQPLADNEERILTIYYIID